MSNGNSEINLDILDSTIDELADYVGFEPFPVGDYKCQFSYEATQVGEDKLPALRAKFKLLEVMGLAKDTDTPPAEGKEVAILYILRNKDGEKLEISEGLLKRDLILPFKEVFGGDKVSEILENADGCKVAVTFGIRVNKKDPDQKNNVIKALVVEA